MQRSRPGDRRSVELPGRAVLDAMRLVRASGRRLDDFTLDGVAQAILGEGKTVSARGEAKLRELERLRRDEPVRFCAYCLRDAELVLAILARTGLDALTARRAALTGVSLDLAWSARLPRGEFDGELVYRKALRRPAEAYETQTPQVRARLLGWTDRRGRVDYVMTRTGPEPMEARSGAPLDYEHYLEKQLRPIAQSIAQALGTTADEWLGDAGQLGLFASPDAGRSIADTCPLSSRR